MPNAAACADNSTRSSRRPRLSRDMKRLEQQTGRRLKVAVNLSPRQLRTANLTTVIADALGSAGWHAEDLELEDPPVFDRLGEISVPTSLMVGDADYPPLVESNRQAGPRIPGCEFVLVPGMDHLPPLREPALVLDLITRTLDRAGW